LISIGAWEKTVMPRKDQISGCQIEEPAIQKLKIKILGIYFL